MNKRKKVILAWFLTVLMVVGYLGGSVYAFAAEDEASCVILQKNSDADGSEEDEQVTDRENKTEDSNDRMSEPSDASGDEEILQADASEEETLTEDEAFLDADDSEETESEAASEDESLKEDNPTEDSEAIEDDVNETEEADDTVKEYRYQDEDILVTAVPEKAGALPADARLSVTKITEENDSMIYEAYQTALEAYDLKDTILFYDISFLAEDEDEKTVSYEPEKGSVKVSISFQKKQLSKELAAEDAEEIKLFHLPFTEEADPKSLTAEDVHVEEISDSEIKLKKGEDTAKFSLDHFSGIAAAVANTDTTTAGGDITSWDLITALSDVSEFSIFAIEFNNSSHMEGNIAVQYLTGCQSQFGNSLRVETTISGYKVAVKKIVEGKGGTFTFAAFRKSNNAYVEIAGTRQQVSVGDDGSGTLTLSGSLTNGVNEVYIYEIGNDGNPIINSGSKAVIGDHEYEVVYSGRQKYSSLTSSNNNNTSYVEYFPTSGSSNNILNTNASQTPVLVIGKDNTLTRDSNGDPLIIRGNGSYSTAKAGVVQQVTGSFPIDFTSLMNDMSALVKQLANTSGSSDKSVKVVNVTASSAGFAADVARVTGANASSGYADFTSDQGVTNQYILVNIDCTSVSSYALDKTRVDGLTINDWPTTSSAGATLIYNPYKTTANGEKVPYTGTLQLYETLGLVLAPEASVSTTTTVVGEVIARKIEKHDGEFHKRSFGPSLASGAMSVTNTYQIPPTSLKIRKTFNEGNTGVTTDQLYFIITGPDNYSKIISYREMADTGDGREYEITGLAPGDYTVTEYNANIDYYIRTTTWKSAADTELSSETWKTVSISQESGEENNKTTHSLAEGGETVFWADNSYVEKTYELTLQKIDGRSGETLPAGEVSLSMTKVEEGKSETPVKDQNGVASPTIDDTGCIYYSGLLPGSYKITEVTTAAGYMILKEPITVEIDKNGMISASYSLNGYVQLSSSDDGHPPTLVIKNFKTIYIPETGRRSALLWYVSGIFIMLGGIVFLTLTTNNKNPRRRKG